MKHERRRKRDSGLVVLLFACVVIASFMLLTCNVERIQMVAALICWVSIFAIIMICVNNPQKHLQRIQQTMQQIMGMSGLEFERYVKALLTANGYTGVKLTKASGDFGVDILAERAGWKYALQCKRYKSPVGIKAVQEIVAGCKFYGCDIAVVLATSTFTKSAFALARKTDVRLWGSEKIYEMQSLQKKVEKNIKKTAFSRK